jgi:hypothetical protein
MREKQNVKVLIDRLRQKQERVDQEEGQDHLLRKPIQMLQAVALLHVMNPSLSCFHVLAFYLFHFHPPVTARDTPDIAFP